MSPESDLNQQIHTKNTNQQYQHHFLGFSWKSRRTYEYRGLRALDELCVGRDPCLTLWHRALLHVRVSGPTFCTPRFILASFPAQNEFTGSPPRRKGKGRGATHKLRGSSDSWGTMSRPHTECPSSAGGGVLHQAAINQNVDKKKTN